MFSDENKKSWEDNKNSGLDYFFEMELDISWEGDSTWECSQGSEDCHYSAEIKVAPLKDSLNTSLIDDLLKENPFITDEEIADVYENDLNDYLDYVFSDYCEGDDYYPPNTEDFEIEYYVGKWCQKNGFKLISANGDGNEDDLKLGLDVIRVKIFKRLLNSVRISNHRSSTVVLMYNSPSPLIDKTWRVFPFLVVNNHFWRRFNFQNIF